MPSVEVTTVPESLVGAEIGLYIRAERGRVVGEYMKQRGASRQDDGISRCLIAASLARSRGDRDVV